MTHNQKLFERRKGQSAIEYLMTYGWMLLVVAIVGGAIFATVQGQCAKQASGFTGQAVTVDSFGATSNNLQVVFRNGGSQQVNITSVAVKNDDGTIETNSSFTSPINVGETQKIMFSTISKADACNNYDLEVTFDKGDITNQVASGGISGNMAQE